MVSVSDGFEDIEGVRVGHSTRLEEGTGCTVIAFDKPALTAAEVRGAAPGTRELDLLAPGRTVQRADAILLTGGSAFGLRAATGVARELAANGRGFPTPATPVPIVPAAVIFDLEGDSPAIPTEEDGARAWQSAAPISSVPTGRVGAGTGARWGAIRGADQRQAGGFGIAQIRVASGTVTALSVVNALGVVIPEDDPRPRFLDAAQREAPFGQSTSLISVVTDVPCDHSMLTRMCVAAHDALARTIRPSHTLADGDVAFVSAVKEEPHDPVSLLSITIATELAVEASLVRAAHPREG